MDFIKALEDARSSGRAVGAFNIFNAQSARAVASAANETGLDTIIQTSVKTVKFYGARSMARLVRASCEGCEQRVFLHLDHCRDLDFAKECVDAGWDAVMLDGSALPLEQNIELCREAVRYAHERGVAVEGELGRVFGVEEDVVVTDSVGRTSFEDCLRFVKETGIDLFAPGVGTAHGVYKGTPVIDYELVEALSGASDIPLVIHGGTGLGDEVFRRLISLGACKINVSTALKGAYYRGIKEFLEQHPNESEPLKLDAAATGELKETVLSHMRLFGGER